MFRPQGQDMKARRKFIFKCVKTVYVILIALGIGVIYRGTRVTHTPTFWTEGSTSGVSSCVKNISK